MKSLFETMKLGIVHFMAFPETSSGTGPITETVAKIAEDPFFDSIEVTHIEDEKVRKEAASLLAQGRLEVGFGAQPVQLREKIDLNSLDEETRRKSLARLKELLEEAKELGAKKFAVLSGPDTIESEQAMEALIDSLTELSKAANDLEMEVVLEVFDKEIEKKRLIGSTDRAVKIASSLQKSTTNFGLMLDQGHLPQLAENVDVLVQAKDYLKHIHIGNCVLKDPAHPAYGDQHPRFGLPEGENDIEELVSFLKTLKDIGYIGPKRGTVAFEVKPMAGENPLVVIANSKRTLKNAWLKLALEEELI